MDFTPEERAIFALRAGDVVLVDSSGSPAQVGRAALWSDEIPGCCYQNHVIRFRAHSVDPRYALLVFRHYALAGIFAQVARGVGIQHLGASRLAKLPFLLPPWPEQLRIVFETERRLGELRGAEHSLRSAMQRIEEQRQAILAAAVNGQLVEPEAAIAKREKREFTSAEHLLVGMEARMHQVSLLEDAQQETELDSKQVSAVMPPGWASVRIDKVGDLKLGRQRSPDKQTGRYSTKYLRAANITADGLDLKDVFEMDFEPAEREAFNLIAGDIVLAEASGSAGQVGRSALWQGQIPHCCYQNTVIRFRPGVVNPDYALLVFRYLAAVGDFARVARGVGIQHLGLSRLAAMPFPLPPISEQQRIVNEARQRLDASTVQDNIVRTSLERLPIMEAELLAAAVNGNLVSQNPTDERASTLLSKLGENSSHEPKHGNAVGGTKGEKQVTTSQGSTIRRVAGQTDLAGVVRDAGHSLSLPELFSLAGYNRDSVADVEHFYLELRDQVGTTLRVVDGEEENALVEAVSNAT